MFAKVTENGTKKPSAAVLILINISYLLCKIPVSVSRWFIVR